MAKKKGKKRASKSSSGQSRSGGGFGTKQNFEQEINKVKRLLSRGEDQTALDYLQELTQRYPGQAELLELQMTIAADLEDGLTCGKAAAQLLELDPNHGDGLYIMASMALQKMHPILAWHLSQRALAQDDDHPMTEGILAVMGKIEEGLDELVAEVEGLPREAAIELLINHEWGQLYLNWGESEKCKAAELKVIAQKPDFMPAYNNLSLIALTAGDMEEAIAQAEKVLTFEPENVHALANLVRFCLLQGEAERAKDYGQRLKASKATAWDLYTKKVEGLTYLRDHEGILEIWQQAKAEESEQSIAVGGLVFHWVAVAYARTGNLAEAKKLWKEALQRSPELKIAQQNLDDLLLPIGQRNSPWPFAVEAWMSPSLKADLYAAVSSLAQASNTERLLSKVFAELSNQHAGFLLWVETMLMEGDEMGRRIAMEMAAVVRSPELLEILEPFALSDNGPDQLRQQAAQVLVEEEVLSPEKVGMWLQGQWRELNLIGFQLTDEPQYSHSKLVGGMLLDAIDLLREHDAEDAKVAEELLQDALKMEHTPDLLNNLAVSFQLQGRQDEALALYRQTLEEFPKYIPATVFLAQRHVFAEELEKAEALMLPLLQCKEMHFQEFAQFSDVYMDLLGRKGDFDGADNWLAMWESAMPGHPRLKYWKERMANLGLLAKVKQIKDAPIKPRKSKSTGEKLGKKK